MTAGCNDRGVVTIAERANAWLDRVPRPTDWTSGRGVPAFRAAMVVGFHVAAIVTLIGALRVGLSMVVGVGLAIVGAGSFLLWSFVRRLIVGREDLVLLEHVWLFFAASAGYLTLVDQPVWAWLDVVAVACVLCLACGRIGCLMAGCCHGAPSGVGITYVEPGHASHGVRLFPVQLLEAVFLGVLGIGGFAALGSRLPGAVVLALGAAYAIGRIGTESLRGDVRRRFLGITAARAMAVAQLLGIVALDEWRIGRGFAARQVVPAAAAAAVVTVAAVLWRRPRPLDGKVIAAVHSITDAESIWSADVTMHHAGEGVTVGVSVESGRRHVSVAVSGGPVDTAARLMAAALGAEPDIVTAAGVAHCWLASAELVAVASSVPAVPTPAPRRPRTDSVGYFDRVHTPVDQPAASRRAGTERFIMPADDWLPNDWLPND